MMVPSTRELASVVRANALSMRHLSRVAQLAESGTIAQVAERLNCSPAAVTKSINEIERLLAITLFDRVGGSYRSTREGEILSRRSRAAIETYRRAFASRTGDDSARAASISNKRAEAFLAAFDRRNLRQAATDLNITKSAVYGAIATLEKSYAAELFYRERDGELNPTLFGHDLAKALKLARAEIRFALEEIASAARRTRGRVEIGVLPRAREYLLPRAINRLIADHPEVAVCVLDAPGPSLLRGALSGELDFVVGPFKDKPIQSGLVREPLLVDHFVAITSRNHPLAKTPQPSLSRAIGEYGWIVGLPNSTGRRIFREVLESSGLTEPAQMIETNSFSLMQSLLLQGNWIALSTVAEIYSAPESGQFETLNLHLSRGTERDAELRISVLRRTGTTLPPAAKLALDYLHATAEECEADLESARTHMFGG